MNANLTQTPTGLHAAQIEARVKESARCAMQRGMGPKFYAAAMEGAPRHETLLAKFNPYGEKALRVSDLLEVFLLAYADREAWPDRHHAFPPLAEFCEGLGHIAIPMPDDIADTNDSIEMLLLHAAKELGDVVAAFLRAVDPKGDDGREISDGEWEEIWRELLEAIQTYWLITAIRKRRSGTGDAYG